MNQRSEFGLGNVLMRQVPVFVDINRALRPLIVAETVNTFGSGRVSSTIPFLSTKMRSIFIPGLFSPGPRPQ
jgi:hypothetical protein